MNLNYICNHILRILHTQIRQYKITDGYELIQYYGDTPVMDVVREDSSFAEILFSLRKEEHPVIYMEVYPVYYSIIYHDIFCFIIGPVNVEKQKTFHEGMSVDAWLAKKHGIKEMRIPYCDYEVFCQDTLLLFHALTGKELTYQQLHEKNHITDELRASLKHRESRVFFHYHEHTKIHNPYGRERREMESIRKGDVDRLQKSLDETFAGEYAVLSKNALQAAKNLAIVGLAISARAAIEGGLPYEESFSINDSYILEVDESRDVGTIETLVRQAKLQYAELVRALAHGRQKNSIIEECKNLIFERMHSRIIVRELADELHVSLEYLSALFKKTEGICIRDYIMKQKIQLAENLLTYSEYSLEQIGLYLGFSSQSHFGAVFKKYEGISPKQYRSKYAKKDFSK